MARFLISSWPFSGHINPSMAVAHALRQRGHEVAFYTGNRARNLVTREGFTCFGFRNLDEDRLYQTVSSPQTAVRSWRRPLYFVGVLKGWILSTIPDQLTDLDDVLARFRPDAIIADVTMWGPSLVLHETHRIPVAVLSYACGCMIPGPKVPPWGLGLPPPRGLRRRLLSRAIGAISDVCVADFRRTASRIRLRYGLAPLTRSVHEFLGDMPLYLVPSVPELDYGRRDLPSSVHYVGPLVWNRSSQEPAPAWMETLSRNRPWVHVSQGTMHTHAPILLQAAARGLANLPLEVIMTSGGAWDLQGLGLGSVAPNVRMEGWVPHSDLLPKTDVVITTGGAGTVLTSLLAGVPMLLVPTEWDKPDNAQRVVEAGAGLRLSPRRCTPARLRAAVERILTDDTFRRNARQLGAALARAGGAGKAAELIERYFVPGYCARAVTASATDG